MSEIIAFETPNLSVSPLSLEDAQHILALNLDPGWKKFIGDRGVYDLASAREYITNGPLRMYRDYGFGVLAVRDKVSREFIGTCGLLQREKLSQPDIGFAFLPKGRGKGYALESSNALLMAAQSVGKWSHINALVTPANSASINLLSKLQFNYVKSLPDFDKDKDTHLYRLTFDLE